MTEEYEISVMLVTEDYRGDHAADVRKAIKVSPEETVGEVVRSIMGETRGFPPEHANEIAWDKIRYQDWLEIRIVDPRREGGGDD